MSLKEHASRIGEAGDSLRNQSKGFIVDDAVDKVAH
jgi:hypothetical protein